MRPRRQRPHAAAAAASAPTAASRSASSTAAAPSRRWSTPRARLIAQFLSYSIGPGLQRAWGRSSTAGGTWRSGGSPILRTSPAKCSPTYARAHARSRARDFRPQIPISGLWQPTPISNELWRRQHQGPQGPRRGAQAPRHVHRRHRRRLGPPPHGVRGFRQCDRRGARRPLRPDPDPAEPRRIGHGRGQRPRHPDRHPRRGRRVGGRGHHDPAPRRR